MKCRTGHVHATAAEAWTCDEVQMDASDKPPTQRVVTDQLDDTDERGYGAKGDV